MTLHFYSLAGESLHHSIVLSLEWAEPIVFLCLWAVMVITFKFIREGWLLILKMEAKPGLNQWGGGIVGVFRSFLVCGMLFFLIAITGNKTLNTYAGNSVSGQYLRDLSPKVYEAAYSGVVAKFFPEEKINTKALSVIAKEKVSKKK